MVVGAIPCCRVRGLQWALILATVCIQPKGGVQTRSVNHRLLPKRARAEPGAYRGCGEAAGTYLLVLVLLQVARRHQALGVDVGRDLLRDQLRVRVEVLHLQEGEDVLHLHAIRAVRHRLALGGEAAGGHPAGVLPLLQPKRDPCTISRGSWHRPPPAGTPSVLFGEPGAQPQTDRTPPRHGRRDKTKWRRCGTPNSGCS